MKWFDLDKKKPKDQERVLCFHPETGPDHTGRIHFGIYYRSSDHIKPDATHGFDDVRWWMPLPAFPRSQKKTRPRPEM